jgi:hypothetical protein
VFAVLLYPPIGEPRVVPLPKMPRGFSYGVKVFLTEDEALAALGQFLSDHPEYRRWKDGVIQQ